MCGEMATEDIVFIIIMVAPFDTMAGVLMSQPYG
jgi:hypothetical protein